MTTDKILDTASKEELLDMARKAQAERDRLVTENGKLESQLTKAEIAIHTAQQEDRAPIWPPGSGAPDIGESPSSLSIN